MRNRVATLFRAGPSSFDLHTKNPEALRSLVDNVSSSRGTAVPSRQSLCCNEEQSVKAQGSHKWISIPSLHCPKCCSHKITQATSSLDVEMESPPLMLYGPTTTSSGALFSGQLILHIMSETLVIESLNMSLGMDVTRKKPSHTHFSENAKQRTVLESWPFLHGPIKLRKGKHKFPFSWILPGNLPASTKGSLFTIEYDLYAVLSLHGAEVVTLSKILDVKRAIIPSEEPRKSIRIFPPTNLTAYCELPSVIHPFGVCWVSVRIDGCVREDAETKILRQWKLKRLHWHLDETQKVFSPDTRKNSTKSLAKDEESKGATHTDVRVVGEDCYRMGWKTDFSMSSGRVEMEFPCSIRPGVQPLCDMKTEDIAEVSHSLVIEMVVIEEIVFTTRIPIESIATGAARVLRMHFNVIVTERSGLGISWDEEQPPLYENVPASPPKYGYSSPYQEDSIPDYEGIIRIDAQRASPESAMKIQKLQN
ncbi:Uncharacterized protein C1F12.05 [Golovinomyces cichoracearum]|uniref:Uncharacterized protein C1F12.05 n=1 Tax=Golovinomyces cichoracearum TaxID=62708 RepID=A0A420ICX8_9PEZI|nr:Uncharacterized protein C1F12.05 [Golovinomyces cichoracearum]